MEREWLIMGNVKVLIQKWVAVITMIVIFLGQYAITGYLATSYAIDLLATQSNNVQFRAYFKNGEEELTEIERSIDSHDLKLKIDVAVKTEGYFNGQISFQNAGFKLTEATANNYIREIRDNVIYLNQINSEETASVEVGIEYLKDNQIQPSTLNQTTTTKLNGEYTFSGGKVTIDGESDVKVIWKIPENVKAELAVKLQTNSTYQVNEENKKIVQFLTSSKLTNNAFPVKSTQITATIPTGATNVEVHKRTTKATNGDKDFTSANYNVENNVLTITVNNEEIDEKISWEKGVNDIFVVTYEYPENTDLSAQTITINEKIIAQNNTELIVIPAQLELNEEKDGIASISKQEGETSIYKGKIYSEDGRDISSYSIVYVEYVDGIKDLEITEENPKFVKEIEENGQTTEQESEADVNIKSVKVNKEKVESVLGNTWTLTIGDKTITNETQTDENGDISVVLNDETKTLTIKTSKPVNNGLFTIETKKRITGTNYTIAQLKEFTKLKDGSSIKYIKNNDNVFKFTSWYNVNLKDTESKAGLQSEQIALIASSEMQELNLTAILESSEENQDLYKNPEIKIKLPTQIRNVTYVQAPQLMYANGLQLTTDNYKIIEENGQKVLSIKLTGEQTSYLGGSINGTTILIRTNVELDSNATNSQEEIVMTYTNENATKYTDNGTEKVNIQIQQQPQGGNTGNGESETGNEGTGSGNTQQTGSEGQSNQGENQGTQGENQAGNQGTQGENQGTQGEQGGETGSGSQNENANVNAKINCSVSAKVGGETIAQGDTVKAGEIIEYTLKIENRSTTDIEGISINGTVPNNTKLIEVNSKYPKYDEENHVYTEDEPYFIEKDEQTINQNGINIRIGGIYEFKYNVKVKSDLNETKEIVATQNINYNNINASTSFGCHIEPGVLQARLNLAYKKNTDVINLGYDYLYQLYITNNSNIEQNNVQVYLNINNLMEKTKIQFSSNGPKEDVDIDTPFITIPSIQANGTAYVEYGIKIKNYTNELNKAEAVCIIKDSNNNEYKSNKVTNEIAGVKLDVNIKSATNSTSTTNNINLGDEITYTITVKNIGETDADNLSIEDKFSDYLDLQSVTLNGNTCEYTEISQYDEEKKYNILKIETTLEAGKEDIIIIKGKVKTDLYLEDDLIIINQAEVSNDISTNSTETITYYLKSKKDIDNSENNNQGEDNTNIENQQENVNTNNNNNNVNEYGNETDNNNENEYEDSIDTNQENEQMYSENINNNQSYENNDLNLTNISGLAWFDSNENGQRDLDEQMLNGINATLYDVEENENINTTTTDENGKYVFSNVENGKYVVIFDYDKEKYALTYYQVEGVNYEFNSDAENIIMNIDGENKNVCATDTLIINDNSITNIDIGLVKAKLFDLSLAKTITNVSVSNLSGNKSIDFMDTNLAKVEIKGKYLKGSVVMIEYKIKVTNNGELAGYVKKIEDKKPSDLKFNSKLNPDWYQKENVLYTTSLENEIIEPGESKEVTLILTKTMTASNTGLTNNKAKITEYYNAQGVIDENLSQNDDISQADLIIGVSTGVAVKFSIITLVLSIVIATSVYIIIKKKI